MNLNQKITVTLSAIFMCATSIMAYTLNVNSPSTRYQVCLGKSKTIYITQLKTVSSKTKKHYGIVAATIDKSTMKLTTKGIKVGDNMVTLKGTTAPGVVNSFNYFYRVKNCTLKLIKPNTNVQKKTIDKKLYIK